MVGLLDIDTAEVFSTAQILLMAGSIYWCHRISRDLSLASGWGRIWLVLMITIGLMLTSRAIVFLATFGEHPALVDAQR
jgi:hypothetical protein